jgi:hypothetical protein
MTAFGRCLHVATGRKRQNSAAGELSMKSDRVAYSKISQNEKGPGGPLLYLAV